MLTIYGKSQRGGFCDGVNRRDFLKIGGMVMGGLTLPQLLRAEAEAGVGSSHKAIINVFLPGGPPHQDMWDLKMDTRARFEANSNRLRPKYQALKSASCFRGLLQ